jgi:biotin transporter BioY
MNAIGKYLLFVAGCVAAYFEPLGFLLRLVLILFLTDFVTGFIKSRRQAGRWTLQSRKLRRSFVKMFVYMCVMTLTFYVCGAMQLAQDAAISVVKVEVWCIVYIEGLSIVENLRVLFPQDKFLSFVHYLLSVEFLKYVPLLNGFFNEKEDGNKNGTA